VDITESKSFEEKSGEETQPTIKAEIEAHKGENGYP
jgi:hypothetical protein